MAVAHWTAAAALACTLTGCVSTSGGGSSSSSSDSGVVSDDKAVLANNCDKGTDDQQAGCQLATIDGAISIGSRNDYPDLVRQAAAACGEPGRSVADQVTAAHEQEKDRGAPHADSTKTLLHIVINDGPVGSDGCAGTLAVHILSVIPG